MGRRKPDQSLGYLVLLGAFLAAVVWLVDFVTANAQIVIVVVLVLVVGTTLFVFSAKMAQKRREKIELQKSLEQRNRRRALLVGRFGREDVADAIMAGLLWHDMTKEELIESWGKPEDISTKVLKNKIIEIYKYRRIAKNRYARKATLENDRVVGWED